MTTERAETWEFLSLQQIVEGPVGKQNYFTASMRIGNISYEHAVIATGYLLFAQLPLNEFQRLADQRIIRGVRGVRAFLCDKAKELRARPQEAEPLEKTVDKYDLGLENAEVPIIPIRHVPIRDARELVEFYPFTHIGESDIHIMGRYREMIFQGATITGSKLLKGVPLLGMGFVSLLDPYAIGNHPEFGVSLHGFLHED